MARKINLNSSDLYSKLGTPSISPLSTASVFLTTDRRRSSSQEYSNHVQSPDFSRQLPRTELRQFSSDVHEKRFVAFQAFPVISSRVPKVTVPDLAKTTGRKFMGIYNKGQVQQDYSPNYQAVWKGTGKKLVGFEVALPRSPLYRPPQINLEKKDVCYKQIDPNVPVPNLEKNSPRPNEKKVPSFMVNVHYLDRVTGHVVPNLKSLQMNSFMNSEFLPLKTGFGERGFKSKSVMRTTKGHFENNHVFNDF
jgi:hypothetical protein